MKFNCDRFDDWLTSKLTQRRKRLEQWHKWFTWYPVKLKHGDCRWLEYVQRKIVYFSIHTSYTEYKDLKDK